MRASSSLRRRFIAILGLTFLIVLAALGYLFQYVMLPTLTLEEDHNARLSLERVQADLDRQLHELEIVTKNWALWDEAYAFMRGENPHFVEQFITPALFDDVDLSLLMLTDSTDMVRWVAGIDPASGAFTSCPAASGACAWAHPMVKSLQAATPRTNDALLLRRSKLITAPRLTMISQCAIFHSDGSGPIAGRLTMARFITPAWLARLRQHTGLDVTLRDDPSPALYDGVQVEVQRIDGRQLRATMRQPAPPFGHQLITEILLPRDRLNDGVATYYLALVAIVGLLVVVLLVALTSFQRMVLTPISRLTAYAQSLHRQQANVAAPLELLERDDEIGTMAREFQYLIDYQDERAANLKALTYTDALTGLGNRRLLDERLPQMLSLTHRLERPVTLIMLDVDHFKAYNDFYGHPEGDRCLKMLAETLRDLFQRESDLIARVGGEEFVIVLPDVDPERAMEVASGVRTAIEAQCIPHERSPTNRHITVSVGVAISWPSRQLNAAALIEQADRALYDAKRTGRNTVGYAYPLAEASRSISL